MCGEEADTPGTVLSGIPASSQHKAAPTGTTWPHEVSGQGFEDVGNILQYSRITPFSPVQGDHPRVGFDLVDARRQARQGLDEARIFAGSRHWFHHTPGVTCQKLKLSSCPRRRARWYCGQGLGGSISSQCGHCCGASCMANPMRRASSRNFICSLCLREPRSQESGLRISARIDTTSNTVISVVPIKRCK